jgi:hypothetical protein
MKGLSIIVTGVASAICLMSAPAAKAFSLPVMTMQPTPLVGVEGLQRGDQFRHQRTVERVQRLRPVQLHHADAAFLTHEDVGKGFDHREAPLEKKISIERG